MALLWHYLKTYKKLLAVALVLAAINQIFSLLDPYIFQHLIDNYATKIHQYHTHEFLRGVLLLLLASMGAAFVSRVAKNFQDYAVNVIVQRLGARMYAHSVEHSFSLPYSVFEDQRSGELLQKLQKARTDAQALVQQAINVIFLSLVGIAFVITYAFIVHWLIGLVYLLIIPILGSVTFIISRSIKTAQKTIVAETAALAGSTTETVRNVELVKSLGLESQEIERLNTVNENILQLELKKVRLVRKFSFLQGTLINTLRSCLMFVMLYLLFQGHLSLGAFFSLLFYSFAIFMPLGELGNVAATYQETRASMERLQEVLTIPATPQPEHPAAVERIASVSFSEVSFAYASRQQALSDISFTLSGADTVAFVGPSGSGKTTIIKLLVGLYSPTAGEVLVNGLPLKSTDMTQYRKRIGFVSQDTQLFAGTIRENLLFAEPQATDRQCRQALEAAAATGIINRGEEGLETRIGEGGLKLSGGEKQRLAIARALLRNPDMIIFDEATSSLDSLTEEQITATIKTIKTNRPNLITVLVAHRLSTVTHAQRIFVLERGHIIEEGNHTELLNTAGLYGAMWRQQVAGETKTSLS